MAVDELVEKFEKSKVAEALRVTVVGTRLIVDVESGRIRGYVIGARNRRLRVRIDGYIILWDPEADAVVWAGGRGQ